jgi:hypothetical protein
MVGNVVSCEIFALLSQLITGMMLLFWQGYFLFVLNAYIYRFQANEGEGMLGAEEQPDGKGNTVEGLDTTPP